MYHLVESFLRDLSVPAKERVVRFLFHSRLRDTLEADILIHRINEGPNGWDKMKHGCGGS